jgi:hypothetical protein
MGMKPSVRVGRWIAPLLSLALLGGAMARASVIMVDFGRGAMPGVPAQGDTPAVPAVGDSMTAPGWTPYRHNQAAAASLLTTTGANSGYTLFHSGGSLQHLTELDNRPTNPRPPAAGYPESTLWDGVYDSNTRTFTLAGLDNSSTYNLVFYGWVNRPGAARLTDITINGTTQSYDPARVEGGLQGDSVSFLDLTPTDGKIQFTVARGAGNSSNWILGTMEIHTIPEPGSAVLMAFATVPVVLSRRRR